MIMDYGNKIIVLGCPGSGKSTFSKNFMNLHNYL
jgi:adenylate kinase family enzyme